MSPQERLAEAVVVRTIARQLDVPPGALERGVPLLALEGMESVVLLRAVGEIEDACGVSLPDDAFVDPISTDDLVALVEGLLGSALAVPALPPAAGAGDG